jgi:hypothetical protein
LSKRKTNGWGSTRDTLVASSAITEVGANVKPDFTVRIFVNSELVLEESINQKNIDWKIFDIQNEYIDNLKVGKNKVRIEVEGKCTCHVSSSFKRWMFNRKEEKTSAFELNRKINDDIIVLAINAKNPISSIMVEQPLPTVMNGSIQVNDAEFFNVVNGVCQIFFASLEGKKEITIRMEKIHEGKCLLPSARAFEMYNPNSMVITQSQEICK